MDKRINLFVAFLIFVVVFSITAFFLIKNEKLAEAPDGAIAQIAAVQSEVNFKRHTQNLWREADLSISLFNNDYVHTGDDSSAEVSFVDKSQIEMSENTMIRITKRDDEEVIDIGSGFLVLNFLKAKNIVFDKNFTLKNVVGRFSIKKRRTLLRSKSYQAVL